MQWYYAKNGSQLGPIEQGELLAKLSSGEIAHSDMVWREGLGDWLPVSKVNELMTIARPVSSSTPGAAMNSPYTAPAASPHNPLAYGGGLPIPNYLWQAIVVTFFCCLPLGIPAIVYAAKVDALRASGDIPGAMAASASAKTWCFLAFGFGIGALVLWFAFVGLAAFSAQH